MIVLFSEEINDTLNLYSVKIDNIKIK